MRFSPMILLLFAMLGCGSTSEQTSEQTSEEITSTQNAVIAALKKHGFSLDEKYDNSLPGNPLIKLHLFDEQGDAAGLEHLKRLTKLQTLSMNHSNVTDAGLVHLKGLTKLHTLRLGYTKITDKGLVHLKSLTNLKILALDNNKKITDSGLEHLKKLTKLQALYLGGTKVTDEGVKKLQTAIPKCRIRH